MCCPKSSVPFIPWSCGTDGWFTDQLLNGGFTTGFSYFIYDRSNPSTNQFVIKSQIEVTNKGFNMEPSVNVKGTPYVLLNNKK